jgi:hypothetical protein
VDSDEFQAWYREFTTFPSQAISEAQYQINAVINKYIEGGNRTNRQKQSFIYATERYRDLKIILQNRLVKVKSSLRSQLSQEIDKPIYNSATFIWHMAYPKTPRSQSISSMINWSKTPLNHCLPEIKTGLR